MLLLLLAACDRNGPDAQLPAADTGRTYEGLSREEIQEQAEPMTLEQAESLGIVVDTTIGIQAPPNPDTIILPDNVRMPVEGTPPPTLPTPLNQGTPPPPTNQGTPASPTNP